MFLSLPIVDAVLPLSLEQLAFFDCGLKYVPLCQSRFSRQPIDEVIKQKYKKLKQRIADNIFNYCMSASDQRAIDHFASMKQLLQRLYTAPLSSKVTARAQCNHNMVKSIKRRLQQSNIIVRPTDKSQVFYFTSASDFERKAHEYVTRTNVCPVVDIHWAMI